MNTVLTRLGPMRVALLLFTAGLVACAPFAGGGGVYEGWRFVPTVLAPVFAPIMLFVLPLELFMSRMFLGEQESEAGRGRYRLIIRIEAAAFVLLILAWLPYLLRLWNASQIN